jgi:phosphatidylinositol kinase/protein kinase (PI-3  family)
MFGSPIPRGRGIDGLGDVRDVISGLDLTLLSLVESIVKVSEFLIGKVSELVDGDSIRVSLSVVSSHKGRVLNEDIESMLIFCFVGIGLFVLLHPFPEGNSLVRKGSGGQGN